MNPASPSQFNITFSNISRDATEIAKNSGELQCNFGISGCNCVFHSRGHTFDQYSSCLTCPCDCGKHYNSETSNLFEFNITLRRDGMTLSDLLGAGSKKTDR